MTSSSTVPGSNTTTRDRYPGADTVTGNGADTSTSIRNAPSAAATTGDRRARVPTLAPASAEPLSPSTTRPPMMMGSRRTRSRAV